MWIVKFFIKKFIQRKIGIFEIDKNIITHQLNFYVIENKKIKKNFLIFLKALNL